MGPAGPVRKDSCGSAIMARPRLRCRSDGADAPSGADATAPVGKETHCVFVVPGPHMTAIPPVFGPMPARRLPPFRPVEPGTPVGPAPVRHPRRARRRKRARSVPVRSRRLVSGPQGGRCPDRIPRLRQARIDGPPAITDGNGLPVSLERVLGRPGCDDLSPSGACATSLSWSSGRRTPGPVRRQDRCPPA